MLSRAEKNLPADTKKEDLRIQSVPFYKLFATPDERSVALLESVL